MFWLSIEFVTSTHSVPFLGLGGCAQKTEETGGKLSGAGETRRTQMQATH